MTAQRLTVSGPSDIGRTAADRRRPALLDTSTHTATPDHGPPDYDDGMRPGDCRGCARERYYRRSEGKRRRHGPNGARVRVGAGLTPGLAARLDDALIEGPGVHLSAARPGGSGQS